MFIRSHWRCFYLYFTTIFYGCCLFMLFQVLPLVLWMKMISFEHMVIFLMCRYCTLQIFIFTRSNSVVNFVVTVTLVRMGPYFIHKNTQYLVHLSIYGQIVCRYFSNFVWNRGFEITDHVQSNKFGKGLIIDVSWTSQFDVVV